MAQLLELAQLINKHSVPEMQIRRSRVKTCLDTQRLAALELFNQFRFNQNLFRTTLISASCSSTDFISGPTLDQHKKGNQPYKITD